KLYFQSGSQYYELFSAQGRGPAENWKVSGSSIRKVFDKELHTYVYSLEGSPSTCKMTLPSDKRKPLSIVHGFLCLQVFLAQNAEFSFELIVTDSGGNRRRLLFSTTVRETACDQLMAKIPLLNSSAKNSWNTLAVDLRAFVAELWREQRYRSLDRVSVAANCRLSRVSTALNEPAESGSAGSGGSCPTRLLNPSKLRIAAWQPLQHQQQQMLLQQQSSSPSSSMASAASSGRQPRHQQQQQ
uniref:DUF667 domain-containing protein n=1 Tax=Macrostomum lignano TaxID=282301 RepID=A0A1I8HJ28_9PLAT